MKKLFLFCWLIASQLSAQTLDSRLLEQVYGSPQPTDVRFEKFISSTTTPIGLGLPVVYLASGFATKNKTLQQHGWHALGSFVVASSITQITKRIVLRERPFVAEPQRFTARIPEEDINYSFPSGHATTAFNAATTLTLHYPKWYVAVPAYAWASAVGYSRMRLGVHYPSDVLAGAVTGAASAWLTYKIQQKWLNRKAK